MRAIIMAGGEGTRLRPLTFSIPKPLLPVDDKPILERIIAHLKVYGISEIILSVGYKSEIIHSYFQDGEKFGIEIKYFEEQKRLGTAGALGEIKKLFSIDENIIIMNGDILTKVDFNSLMKFHVSNKSDFTVGTKEHIYKSRFGVLNIDNDFKITSIEEKPEIKSKISAGIYIMSPSVMDLIPGNKYFDMPDVMNECFNSKKKVLSYEIKEYWLAIEKMNHFDEALKEKEMWKDDY